MEENQQNCSPTWRKGTTVCRAGTPAGKLLNVKLRTLALSDTCQSYQRVTLCIAFNKHSAPRTLSDVNSSAETDFENQAVVIVKVKAGKVVALRDPAMPTRAPFIRARRRPAGHGAGRRQR